MAESTEQIAEATNSVATDKNVSELEEKIIRQVEYYFGDINLGRDKFLRDQITLDDGWVTMETMLKFNRLKQISDDAAVLAGAIRKSELMQVSEDGTKIRRSPSKPLAEMSKDDLKLRSIYAKGFPLDVTLDQVMGFFDKFGKSDNIHMRKDLKKQFKGSCFVVYSDKEGAKNFVETPDVKFSDIEMIRLYRDDYFKNKVDQRKQKSEEKHKKSEEDKQEKEREEKEKLKEKITSGAILNVEGVPSETRRDDVKNFFQKFGTVEWVDIEDSKTRVRFGGEDGAKEALNKAKEENEGKILINDVEVQCRVLEGDEELDHWAAIYKSKRDRQFSNKDKKKRPGDRRGGPQRKRPRVSTKRAGSDDE